MSDDRLPRRLRILVLAPFPPHGGGHHGGARAIAGTLRAIASRHDIGVLHMPDSSTEQGPDEGLVSCCAFIEALPSDDPGGARLWRRRLSVNAALLKGVPMWASELGTSRAAKRVAAVAAAWRPDIVQIDFLPMAVFLTALRRIDTPRVLVDHDATLRPARDFDHLPDALRPVLRRLDARAWRRLDRWAAGRFDATVVFTERDRLALERAHARRTVYIPLVLPPREHALNPVGRPPWTLLFVGYYRHGPNADAATWLARDILPRIRIHHPDVQLVLVGADPPVDLREFEGKGVVLAGRVDDVSAYLDKAAVVVTPMRIGGGVRVKVLEALGAGKAVVATRLGAEGIEAPEGVAILLADSAAEFASCVSALLGDERRRAMLASAAYIWACEHYVRDATAIRYDRLYKELLESRRASRPC